MHGLRILELDQSLASAYCGALFAATGGNVVVAEGGTGSALRQAAPLLEPPGAPGTISAVHEYVNARKRSAVLDHDQLDRAFAWADLVISSSDGQPERALALRERIARANPAAVHVVLSGFGLTGPYARWSSSDLIDWASGGYLYITGEPDREPLQGGGPWPSYLTGTTAAIGAQAAVMRAAATGTGELVDVSAMEAVAAAHQWSLTMYTHTGVVKRRWGRLFGESYHPMALYECSDGWICIGAASREQWERLCITVEQVELLADDRLYAPAERFERADEIDALFAPWLRARTTEQAVAELQENRVPASPLLTFAEILSSPQTTARSLWASVPGLGEDAKVPAAPFRLPNLDVTWSRAPGLGEHTSAFVEQLAAPAPRDPLPRIDLADVTVIEFGVAWAGPLACRFLADLGANVIKVEHPTARGMGMTGKASEIGSSSSWRWGTLPDPQIRSEVFPDADPGPRWWNRMGVWNKMNRGKRSLCLDAKTPSGERVLSQLIERADLLINNYTPRGAASLGIDEASLARLNPAMASVAMTGYGETGPMSTHSSYGPILEAYGGFDEATGYRGGPPMRIGLALPDAIGGVHGAFAALTALWARARLGSAVHVDLSQLETLLSVAGEALLCSSVEGQAPRRRGNRSRQHAPQGVYRCAGEDAWVAVTVADDTSWERLSRLIDELAPWREADRDQRLAAHDEIDAAIERWTSSRSSLDAARKLQAQGVAACPAFTNADLVDSEHLAHRGFLVTWDQPDVGPRQFPGFPILFDGDKPQLRPAPPLGGDNEAVLQWLGYDRSAIDAMQADGTIAEAPPA